MARSDEDDLYAKRMTNEDAMRMQFYTVANIVSTCSLCAK